MKKKYYIISASIGRDRDRTYYLFENKDYFEAFIECNDCIYIENIEYNDYIYREKNELIINLMNKYKEDELFDWITEAQLADECLFDNVLNFFNQTYVETSDVKELLKLIKNGTVISEAEVRIL